MNLKEIEKKIKALTIEEIKDIHKRIKVELDKHNLSWPHHLGSYVPEDADVKFDDVWEDLDGLDSELGFFLREKSGSRLYMINLRTYFEYEDFEEFIKATIVRHAQKLEDAIVAMQTRVEKCVEEVKNIKDVFRKQNKEH